MKPRKSKSAEPSTLDKLSQNFLEAYEADFEINGISTIQQLREKHPDRYVELAARLIATTKPKSEGWDSTKSVQDIARKLLREVGCADDWMSDGVIEEVIEANDIFIAKLEAIRAKAEGDIH
jgi:hypothetical protein